MKMKERIKAMVKRIHVRSHERGLVFRDEEFKGVLGEGKHWFFDPWNKVRVDVENMREPWLLHDELDVIVKSGVLGDEALVLELNDYQRALVWIDGRFDFILGPGLHVFWTTMRKMRTEILDARDIRFEHPDMSVVMRSSSAASNFNASLVETGYMGLLFINGEYKASYGPGQYLFWQGMGKIKFLHVDMREIMLDVSGQELMSADKVTLRMNAVITYKVTDALRTVEASEDSRQAVYREAQLALRAVVGAFELDRLLGEKETAAQALMEETVQRVKGLGVQVLKVGIRDVILPGEMKTLLNKVIEAQKAADANLIMRKEETAAMRSQANTARILRNNPTLMRLRELDVLEKVAEKANLQVVLGEKGLADRVVNLL